MWAFFNGLASGVTLLMLALGISKYFLGKKIGSFVAFRSKRLFGGMEIGKFQIVAVKDDTHYKNIYLARYAIWNSTIHTITLEDFVQPPHISFEPFSLIQNAEVETIGSANAEVTTGESEIGFGRLILPTHSAIIIEIYSVTRHQYSLHHVPRNSSLMKLGYPRSSIGFAALTLIYFVSFAILLYLSSYLPESILGNLRIDGADDGIGLRGLTIFAALAVFYGLVVWMLQSLTRALLGRSYQIEREVSAALDRGETDMEIAIGRAFGFRDQR